MIEIVPAVIPQNLNIVKERFSSVLGLVKKVQMDIADGHYTETITWPFIGDQYEERMKMVRGEEKFPYIDELDLEIDMLLFHPIEYIPDFLSIGAKSFVVHIDSTDHITECIDTIKNAGCNVGLGIKPSGDTTLLHPFIDKVDFIQFMGNDRVGYNGVELDPKVLGKIKNFHKENPSVPIQIDIGVNFETAHSMIEVGVTSLISGSAIWNSENINDAITKLQNS